MNQYDDAPQYLKDFLVYMQLIRGKSEKTVYEYYLDLHTFLRYLKCIRRNISLDSFDECSAEDVSVDELKSVDLSFLYEYMYYVSTVRKNSGSSRARKVSSLRTFFKYLSSKTGILQNNPAKELDTPKLSKTLPKYLSLDESVRLLSSVSGKNAVRDYCILTLFLNCGLRLSELVGINISDLKEDSLTVIGKGDKERTVYLNTACVDAINEYLKVRPHENVIDKKALFLSSRKTRLSGKMVQVIVKKNLEAAGLDTSKYSVHKLRHTAATLMYKYGNVDVRALQEILGHKQLATTQIYTHVDNEILREAALKNPLADINSKVGKKDNETKN